MEHGDVHSFAQRLLDHEAFGRLDILQIDAAEAGLQQCDRVNNGVDILCIQFKVDGIDISEPLEEDRLALHHRLRCQRPKIAEAKNSRAVGDDRDKIAFRRVIIRSEEHTSELQSLIRISYSFFSLKNKNYYNC